MNEQQRQAYLDQINYGRIERVIAYKNVQFILEHQNDTLEQLSAYLQSCMEDIGHPPAMVEVIGSEYIEYRFGSWKAARPSGRKTSARHSDCKAIRKDILSQSLPARRAYIHL